MDRDKMIEALKNNFEQAYGQISDPNARKIIEPLLKKILEAWDRDTEMYKKLVEKKD